MIAEHLFIDTNILIYAFDEKADHKHEVAARLINGLWEQQYAPNISVQVLQEFYTNLIRKEIHSDQARDTVSAYLDWRVIINDQILLMDGIDTSLRWRISFWDGLIVAAAKRAGANTIWSEDLNDGQDYGGVTVINPLIRPLSQTLE